MVEMENTKDDENSAKNKLSISEVLSQYTEMLQNTLAEQSKRSHCYICGAPLAALNAYLEYYDRDRGLLQVCKTCTVKSVDYYITQRENAMRDDVNGK